jgi:hypothetical protein
MRSTGRALVSHGSHEVASSAVTIGRTIFVSICGMVVSRNASRVIVNMLAVIVI